MLCSSGWAPIIDLRDLGPSPALRDVDVDSYTFTWGWPMSWGDWVCLPPSSLERLSPKFRKGRRTHWHLFFPVLSTFSDLAWVWGRISKVSLLPSDFLVSSQLGNFIGSEYYANRRWLWVVNSEISLSSHWTLWRLLPSFHTLPLWIGFGVPSVLDDAGLLSTLGYVHNQSSVLEQPRFCSLSDYFLT